MCIYLYMYIVYIYIYVYTYIYIYIYVYIYIQSSAVEWITCMDLVTGFGTVIKYKQLNKYEQLI